MKKVLFTLATLFAFGLTANAQGKPAPVLAFGYDANNLVTEIEMAPGEEQELHVVIVEQQELVVQGFQLQWLMKNSAGEPETTGVTCPKKYGGRTKTWTNPEGFSLSDENVGGVTGNSLASQILEGYIYRWVGTNTSANQFWFNSDADGNLAAPNAVGAFTVVTSADWNDDYATFELDLPYALYNQTPSDQPADGVTNYEARPTDPMVLKIINKNKLTPATVEDPVITFAEENNVLTVTVSCATEGATLYVNGEAVEGNPYTYTVEHTNIYEEQVVNVEAYAVNGTATSETVKDSYTFQAQEQPTADEPVIEFAEDGSGVMITIENYTEYTIKVDGVQVAPTRNETAYYVEKVYDKDQAIEVWAKNAPGDPVLPAEKTATYNLPAKVKAQNSKPSVTHSYNPETGELNVWAYGCTEDDVEYTLYCDGVKYTGEMPIIVDSEAGYNHTWTATAVSPTTTVSEVSDPDAIVIDAVVPPTVTPDPVITVGEPDMENGTITITVTGQGTVTASVTDFNGTTNYTDEDGDGKIEIVIPMTTEENMVNVNATAQLPGDNVVAGSASENYIYVPAKTAKPVITYVDDPDAQTVTVTATGNGNVKLYWDDMLQAEGNGTATWVIPYGDEMEEYGVSATAQEENKAVSDYALDEIIVPAKQPVTPDYTPVAPKVTIQTNTENVTVEGIIEGAAADYGTVVLYQVDENGERHEIDNPKDFARENEDYKVIIVAVATYENGEVMESEAVEVTITKKEQQPDPTSIDEMNAGKTVANVRYFNMAGQEMQEANGMTIVVTTYTDGTTSAVKVMK